MKAISQIEATSTRLQSVVHKLRWGIRTVGIANMMQGAARLIDLRLRRPHCAEVRLRSGFVLEFDYPSQLPPILVMFGDLIDPEYAFLKEISRPNWIVVDVGAAIGQFTIFAATLPAAMVYAFEPSSTNLATLQRNILRNRAGARVKISRMALSNSSGNAVFETEPLAWMSHLSHSSVQSGEAVSVHTLPEVAQELGITQLSVLKINVSGYEPEVLEGAVPFLARGKADILILLLGLRSLPWYARIASLGYRFFYYHPVEKRLYEIRSFDERSVLDHRPWPARHIIAIYDNAIAAGILGPIQIRNG